MGLAIAAVIFFDVKALEVIAVLRVDNLVKFVIFILPFFAGAVVKTVIDDSYLWSFFFMDEVSHVGSAEPVQVVEVD